MAETPEEELERLISIFEASDMQTLRVVTPTLELFLSRESGAAPPASEAAPELPASSAAPAPAPADHPPAAPAPAEREGHVVRAPMVGTVYCAPAPGKPPFVEVGARVGADDTVCLVEAMKVFTAVPAGESGVVQEVFVANAQMVEFDQELLRIAPDGALAARKPERTE